MYEKKNKITSDVLLYATSLARDTFTQDNKLIKGRIFENVNSNKNLSSFHRYEYMLYALMLLQIPYDAKPKDIINKVFTISVQDFQAVSEIKDRENAAKSLEKAVVAMSQRWVEIDTSEHRTIFVPFLSRIISLHRSRDIQVKLGPEIVHFLTGFSDPRKRYTTISITTVKKFKSNYSHAMYQFALAEYNKQKKYNSTLILRMSFSEIRNVLSIANDIYPSAYNFNKEVLSRISKDMNKFSDLAITFEKIGRGKDVQFLITIARNVVDINNTAQKDKPKNTKNTNNKALGTDIDIYDDIYHLTGQQFNKAILNRAVELNDREILDEYETIKSKYENTNMTALHKQNTIAKHLKAIVSQRQQDKMLEKEKELEHKKRIQKEKELLGFYDEYDYQQNKESYSATTIIAEQTQAEQNVFDNSEYFEPEWINYDDEPDWLGVDIPYKTELKSTPKIAPSIKVFAYNEKEKYLYTRLNDYVDSLTHEQKQDYVASMIELLRPHYPYSDEKLKGVARVLSPELEQFAIASLDRLGLIEKKKEK